MFALGSDSLGRSLETWEDTVSWESVSLAVSYEEGEGSSFLAVSYEDGGLGTGEFSSVTALVFSNASR